MLKLFFQFFQIARRFEIGFCQFLLDVHLDDAIKRNQSRRGEDQVPDDVIKKMAGKFEPPNPMANPWERFSFSLNFDQVQKDDVIMIYYNINGYQFEND